LRAGRLDDAEASYTQALEINQRTGSRQSAYSLIGMGRLYAWRGQPTLARGAYEEAIRAADANGFLQCMVPAQVGLAVVLAGTDPHAAGRAKPSACR
jgi:tetratricopeptide (TPR) repeat protein